MSRYPSRRGFLAILAALAASLTMLGHRRTNAQQPASPRRIGVLLVGFPPDGKEAQGLRQGLRDLGYVEGRDLEIEWRSASGDYSKVPELVAELIQRKVELIVVNTTVGAKTVKSATSTIPIVMAVVADPVGSGLVASLARPGGNMTGFSLMTSEHSPKRLELLKEAIPRLTHVAVLWNPDTPYHPQVIEGLKAVAPSLSLKLKLFAARTPEEFGSVVSAIGRWHADALYVIDDPLFYTHRMTLLELTSKARLPGIYGERAVVEAGGLLSYGVSYPDQMRSSAIYVDKILKGAKPADLPIVQPTQFELVVNLKTAKHLGLTMPQSILQRADEVIR